MLGKRWGHTYRNGHRVQVGVGWRQAKFAFRAWNRPPLNQPGSARLVGFRLGHFHIGLILHK